MRGADGRPLPPEEEEEEEDIDGPAEARTLLTVDMAGGVGRAEVDER